MTLRHRQHPRARRASRLGRVGSLARASAAWLLLIALFYAPWDFGGTSASAIRHLNWILAGTFLLWLIGRVASGNRASFWSGWLLAISLLLLLIGWGMAFNAQAIFDADYKLFLPLASPLPGAPGSVDYALALASVRRLTLLLGCVWIMADLAQDPGWLLRICWAIGLAGGSIALLGLLQKATGAEMIFWDLREPGEPPVTTFFASFYYHGNAGVFLNLVLPVVAGLAYRYTTRPSNAGARALWLTLLLIMIVAVISDTSRMGQFIAALLMLALLILSAGKIFRRMRHLELKTVAVALIVSAIALWAIVRVSHLDQSLGRWEQFRERWFTDARWLVDQAALAALPDAGPLGFGPGTFAAVFPHFNMDPRTAGSWLFLHNDHLQTMLEWGWVGGLLWEALFAGGLIVAFRVLSNRRGISAWLPRQRLILTLSVVALLGVALHALVDFPLQICSIQLYAVTYLGICWGSGNWGRSQTRTEPVKSQP